MYRIFKKQLFASAAMVALCLSLQAQKPGTLDSSFGSDGKIVYEPGLNYGNKAVLIQDDKKVVTVDAVPSLHRFNSDGSIDESFGDNGKILVIFEGVYNTRSANGILLPDGKIVVAGYGFESGGAGIADFILFRVNKNGIIDSSFGINGRVYNKANEFGTLDYALAAALDTKGNIVVTGYRYNNDGGTTAFVTKRYLPDGTWDRSFGDSGVVVTIFSTKDQANSVVCQPDGKVVVGGVSRLYNFSDQRFAIARYNYDGTLDESFGQGGKLETNFGDFGEKINSLALQPDGKIVAGGQSNIALTQRYFHMAVARYNTDGSLDKSFGNAGKSSIPFNDRSGEIKKVLLQLNGKIVAAGNAFLSNKIPYKYGLWRLNADGSADSTFAENGKTITDFGTTDNECNDAALQKDGKIVLVGEQITNVDANNITLARYYGDPVKQLSPIAKKIKRWIKNHTLQWQGLENDNIGYYMIEQSSNGVNGFKAIGKVAAVNRQSASGNNVYSYSLNNASAQGSQLTAQSSNYYRITAVSNSGSNITSDVITDESVSSINISPNPVKDVMKITGLPVNQKTAINIVNRNGNVLQSVTAQSSVYNLNVTQLKSDVYNVVITINNKTQSIKFVKE